MFNLQAGDSSNQLRWLDQLDPKTVHDSTNNVKPQNDKAKAFKAQEQTDSVLGKARISSLVRKTMKRSFFVHCFVLCFLFVFSMKGRMSSGARNILCLCGGALVRRRRRRCSFSNVCHTDWSPLSGRFESRTT